MNYMTALTLYSLATLIVTLAMIAGVIILADDEDANRH